MLTPDSQALDHIHNDWKPNITIFVSTVLRLYTYNFSENLASRIRTMKTPNTSREETAIPR